MHFIDERSSEELIKFFAIFATLTILKNTRSKYHKSIFQNCFLRLDQNCPEQIITNSPIKIDELP